MIENLIQGFIGGLGGALGGKTIERQGEGAYRMLFLVVLGLIAVYFLAGKQLGIRK